MLDNEILILVVDDNPDNIQVVANILQENNYELSVFLNGENALEFLELETPDLILLDVLMPDMDGFELCRIIKQNRKMKDIPIIFLTAKNEIEDLVAGFKLGAVDYITKPFIPIELLLRIKTHIELKKTREEIRKLKGILPICSKCNKIRDDKGSWNRMEAYIYKHSGVEFSHGLCRECADLLYQSGNGYYSGGD